MGIPQFGGNKQIFPRPVTLLQSLTDTSFIRIDRRGIDRTLSGVQGSDNGIARLFNAGLPDA